MAATTPQITQDLFATLRRREAQAREFGDRHLVPVHGPDSMLYWLAEAATQARLAGGRRQVHVAASMSKGADQSTIARFEKHIAWPRDADAIVNAYADDLDIPAADLWVQAAGMFQQWSSSPADAQASMIASLEAQRTRGQRQAGRKEPDGDRPGSAGR